MYARILKFQIWIPHEKIADTYFFFSHQDYAPFLSYGPLKKNWMKSCRQNISKLLKTRALEKMMMDFVVSR